MRWMILLGLVLATAACEESDDGSGSCAEPLGGVAVTLTNASEETLYITGIDDPVLIFRKIGGEWEEVRT